MDITIRAASEHPIEQVEKFAQQTSAFCFRFQDQRCERRTQTQSVERRQNNGDRNGYGKLLIETARNARDECCGDEHSRKHERYADNGPRDFFHSLESGLFWRK